METISKYEHRLCCMDLAGGAHHTGYSQNLTSEHLEDFAEMAGIEYVRIGKKQIYQI